MSETKHTPGRIWACMEGPMVGLFVSGVGATGGWPEYVRSEIADALVEALREAKTVISIMERPEGMGVEVNAALDARLAKIDAVLSQAREATPEGGRAE